MQRATRAERWFYEKCQELLQKASTPGQTDDFYTAVEKAHSEYERMVREEKQSQEQGTPKNRPNVHERGRGDLQIKVAESLGITQLDYDLTMNEKGVLMPLTTLASLMSKVMGIQNLNDREAVKKSFRRLAMEWHPDRSSDENKALNAEKFALLNALYNNIYLPRFTH